METKELIEQLEWWAEECDRTNHGCQARKILQEAADALDKLKKCRHECKIDCLLEEYEKKHDELERVQAELEWKEKVIELARRKEREAEAALEREKTMHQHTAEVAWAHEAELEKVKRERDAAVSDLETIMAYGGGNLDTCQFCKSGRYRANDGIHEKTMRASGFGSEEAAIEAWNRLAEEEQDG